MCAFGVCLTQEEEVHRIQEAGEKAHPVGSQGDGSQEGHPGFLVARTASGVSRRQVVPLSQLKRLHMSNDRSRSNFLRGRKKRSTHQEASFPFRAQPAYRDLGQREAVQENETVTFFF